MTPTPALRHLLGAYLNQDWFDFYADEKSAVDDFVKESPDFVDGLPSEIDRLLSEATNDPQLETYLVSIGCEYQPSPDLGYREWLKQIADRVRSAVTTPGS
jgi:hypothetical protein